MNTLSFCFPASPADLPAAQLTELVTVVHPGTVVQSFEVIKASSFGEGMVSTADRALLMLHYAANPANLPQQTMLKLQRDIGPIIKSIYSSHSCPFVDAFTKSDQSAILFTIIKSIHCSHNCTFNWIAFI